MSYRDHNLYNFSAFPIPPFPHNLPVDIPVFKPSSLLEKRSFVSLENTYDLNQEKKVKVHSRNLDTSTFSSSWADLFWPLSTHTKRFFSPPQPYYYEETDDIFGSEIAGEREAKKPDQFTRSIKIEEDTDLSNDSDVKLEKIEEPQSTTSILHERLSGMEKPALAEFTEQFPEWRLDAIFDFLRSGKNKDDFYNERKAHGRRYQK